MRISNAGIALLAVHVALAGCSTPAPPAPTTGAVVTGSSAGPVSTTALGTPRGVGSSTTATSALPWHLDPKSPISIERSVYFDFDVFSIGPKYTGLIERHGKYLLSQPALSIRIEGNADERGSAEYNLALGQKRAEAVVRALRIYGVKDNQVEAVSWGEEHPQAIGHDEAAWDQNRRADLIYPKR